MACVDSIREMNIPEDVYVAGVEAEGVATLAAPGEILYLNGPGASALKPGSVQRVVRREGRVRDKRTDTALGVYYKDIGTIRVEAVEGGEAIARVMQSCHGMLKGDVVIPETPRSAVVFEGALSSDAMLVPNGLSSSIVLGKDDAKQLAAGHFCFISVGKRDGVQPGDRFTIYRPHPSFDAKDGDALRLGVDQSYSVGSRHQMNLKLHQRSLPARVLGDLVIVESGEKVSTARIINSYSEILPGDRVVKR